MCVCYNDNITEYKSFDSSINPPPSFHATPPVTDTEDDMESHRSTVVSSSTRTLPQKKQTPSNFELESSQYMGIDAVKKLRLHYTINRVSYA